MTAHDSIEMAVAQFRAALEYLAQQKHTGAMEVKVSMNTGGVVHADFRETSSITKLVNQLVAEGSVVAGRELNDATTHGR
jgi:hypothetical protein